MSSIGNHSKAPGDQKTLNEELISGVVEIARIQPQHAVELFGVPHAVATRLATLSETQLDDLATTPVALWSPALTERQVRRLPERTAMPIPGLEQWRPVTERINRLALATFVRYADDPVSAALVCDLRDANVNRALQEIPAFAFLEWGGNPGVPLIRWRLGEALLDRLLRGEHAPVEPILRGLAAFVQATDIEFAALQGLVREDARRSEAAAKAARHAAVKRAGRPPASFLMPAISSLILLMLRHQMRPTEVEDRLLATSDVRAAQLRTIAESLNPRPRKMPGAPRDRSRDHRDLWGSAYRRLTATAIFRLQQRLVDAGVESFEAMVRAFDYYVATYDGACGVSLSRMLRDVFTALRETTETHLQHCAKCGVLHLAHEEKAGIIECPVCVLARAGKFGQRRPRPEPVEAPVRVERAADLPPPHTTPMSWAPMPAWSSAVVAAESPAHGNA